MPLALMEVSKYVSFIPPAFSLKGVAFVHNLDSERPISSQPSKFPGPFATDTDANYLIVKPSGQVARQQADKPSRNCGWHSSLTTQIVFSLYFLMEIHLEH